MVKANTNCFVMLKNGSKNFNIRKIESDSNDGKNGKPSSNKENIAMETTPID